MTVEPTTRKAKGAFLYDVEALRGVLALCVALGHCCCLFLVNCDRPIYTLRGAHDIIFGLISSLLNGQSAVIVFFVISGFVIGRSLDNRRFGIRVLPYILFLVRRLVRLYPAHIVATILILLIGKYLVFTSVLNFSWNDFLALGTATWNGEAFRTITGKIFLQNLLMTDWSLNPVVWSAYSEIVAAFALPFFYLLRNRDNRLLDVVFVFFLFALTCLFPAFVGGKHLFVFYLGMIVPTRGRETSVWLRKRVRNPSALFGAGWLGLVLPAMLMPGRPPLVLLGEAAAAFILVGLVVYERRDNPVSRFLRTDFIRWSGLISFSFYLYHLFFLNAFIHLVCRFLSPTFISGNGLLMYLFAVAGTVPVAFMFGHLSYRFIEKPAVLWGRKILPKL